MGGTVMVFPKRRTEPNENINTEPADYTKGRQRPSFATLWTVFCALQHL